MIVGWRAQRHSFGDDSLTLSFFSLFPFPNTHGDDRFFITHALIDS